MDWTHINWNYVLLFAGSALAMYEINYLIWLIQHKPKQTKINLDVFKTYKHRKKDRDDDEEPK